MFDFFKKNRKEKNNEHNEKTPTNIPPHTENMYEGLYIDGDVLKKVYSNNIQNGTFIVPEYIKSINSFAFSNLENLKTVIMHKDIRYIAPLAFQNCSNLIEVKGLENAKTMKSISGFNSCSKLEKITLPDSIQIIGEGAFTHCKNLKDINIPSNCWSISEHAFADCENLETIKLPSNIELIGTAAFAGCKNLTLTFLNDNKKYLQDIIKEQEEIESQYPEYDTSEEQSEDDSNQEISDEEKEQLYQDLNIKYRKIDIAGEEILWTIGKVIIKPDALSGVKHVIVYNEDTMQAVTKSGYNDKITLVNKEKEETITFDFKAIENYKKELISKAREAYYKKTLIPCGGTLNWLLVCEKYNYKCKGCTSTTVCEIPISFDSKIIVKDLTQPKSDMYSYTKETEEFCTSVTFLKKELDNHSVYAPHEYERAYSIYYPYGARFNEDMLLKIGTALSGLIDLARDLEPSSSKEYLVLQKIHEKQKQLIELFINGTNNNNAVKEIMEDVILPKPTNQIKEAKERKDWLPYFSDSYSKSFKEAKDYRDNNNKRGK